MKKLLLLGIALLAAYMGGRALKRNAEVIQLLWALIGMTATSTSLANTPKARNVEDRLNALVPVVFPNTGGNVYGSMTVAGNHTVNGNASVGGSQTVAGQVNAAAGAFSGATSDFGHTTHGTLNADGINAGSGGVSAPDISASSTLVVSGQRIAPGQGTPGGYPVVGSPSTAGLGSLVNEIIAGLQSAGIFA